MIAAKEVGAAKLDIVLRAIALLPEQAGRRAPGLVLPVHSYAALFDLVRDPDAYGPAPNEYDYSPVVHKLKRKWVGEQLQKLEARKLVRRGDRPGEQRPQLFVLRDDGNGKALDDPDGKGPAGSYVTLNGSIIASGLFHDWGAPELSFYLAAMVAERYEAYSRQKALGSVPWQPGAGEWFRQLDWFADPKKFRPPSHVRIPFSVPTLERGLRSLAAQGLVERTRIVSNPVTRKRFARPRNLYFNRFSEEDRSASRVSQHSIREFLADFSDDEALAVFFAMPGKTSQTPGPARVVVNNIGLDNRQ